MEREGQRDPYAEGWSAGYEDEQADNPYPEGTPEHEEWDKGFWDGKRDS